MKFVRIEYAPAVMEAIARCKRDGGPIDRVEFLSSGVACYTTLPPYDALGLAKDLVFNKYAGVKLITAGGRELEAEAIKEARF